MVKFTFGEERHMASSPEHARNQGALNMSKAKDKACPKGGRHELVTTVIPGTKKCKKCGQVFEE